jgi:hypothetical protein
MVDKHKLLELSAKYLEDYLEKFVKDNVTRDIVDYYQEDFNSLTNINPMYQNLMSNKVKLVQIDKIKQRYSQIMNLVPVTPLRSILDQVCLLEDSLIIDVGSRLGERFGLFVAQRNPTSQVYVFNPFTEIPESFLDQNLLLEDLDRDVNYSPKNFQEIDINNLSHSINQFYMGEGLNNIRFKMESFSKEKLNEIKKKNPSKRIIIHSHRTPTFPKDITYDLSEMVNEFDVDVIMSPLINMAIDHRDKPTLKKINENYRDMTKRLNNLDVRDKIYNIMTLYYALNIAIVSDSDVYQKRTLKVPFDHPNFIVSTINPQ